MTEVDVGEVFGKAITAITWAGDDMCVVKLQGGLKLIFYVKDSKLVMEAILNSLTNRS